MTCRHRKLVFAAGGAEVTCPQCGQRWVAVKRDGRTLDFQSGALGLNDRDVRVDPGEDLARR